MKELQVSPKVRVMLPKLNTSNNTTNTTTTTTTVADTAQTDGDDGKNYKYFCMDCEGKYNSAVISSV